MKPPMLEPMLQLVVPLWIAKVRGYTEEQRLERACECAQVIAEKGDVLQFRSKRKGESAAAFNALAEGLACAAFQPGGVRFASLHFEADPSLQR